MPRKLMTLREVLDQGFMKPPVVRIDWAAKTIDIVDEKHEFRTWKDPYYINFDRIKTAEAALAWVLHLSGKTWWSRRHSEELIFAWQTVTGKQVHFDA